MIVLYSCVYSTLARVVNVARGSRGYGFAMRGVKGKSQLLIQISMSSMHSKIITRAQFIREVVV